MIVRDKMNGLVLSDYGESSQTKGAVKEGQLKRQVQKLIRKSVFYTLRRLSVLDSSWLMV